VVSIRTERRFGESKHVFGAISFFGESRETARRCKPTARTYDIFVRRRADIEASRRLLSAHLRWHAGVATRISQPLVSTAAVKHLRVHNACLLRSWLSRASVEVLIGAANSGRRFESHRKCALRRRLLASISARLRTKIVVCACGWCWQRRAVSS